MERIQSGNNILLTLASILEIGVTTAVVDDASSVPTIADGNYLKLTLYQNNPGETGHEIVHVTAKSGNNLTIVRAQEGTTEAEHPVGTICSNEFTSGTLEHVYNEIEKHEGEVLSSSGHGVAASSKIIGRISSGAGAVEELTAAQVLSLVGPAGPFPFAYQQFINEVHDLFGSANIIGLWFPGHATGTVVKDWSGNGRNGSEGADGSTFSPEYVGMCPTLLRGSGTYRGFTLADNAAFTFGNGTTDSAFSLVTGGILSTATNSATYFAKYDMTTGTAKREYQFWTDGNSKMTANLYDESSVAKIGRMYNAAVVPSTWHSVVFTYSGSGLSSGIKIYLNGVNVDDADSASGSYTAMEDTAALAGPMSNAASGSQTNGFKGRQAPIILLSIVPSALQITLADAMIRGIGGVQL